MSMMESVPPSVRARAQRNQVVARISCAASRSSSMEYSFRTCPVLHLEATLPISYCGTSDQPAVTRAHHPSVIRLSVPSGSP